MDEGRASAGPMRAAADIAAGVAAPLAARVTIVVSLREGHGLALATLDNLLAHVPPGISLFYLDIGSPPPLRAQLERRAAEHGFDLVRFDWPTWPTTARAAILDRIESEYIVFIENDVMVAPGWLEALVRCADETGAGLVGPLYLEGGGAEPMTVHMAGGDLVRRRTPDGETIDESHRLMHAPLATARACSRQTCDFVEYHCLLARRDIFALGVALDRGFGCVHEHIDLSLQVTALGLPIYLEPQAKVLQMRDGDYLLSDLPLLQWRWSEEAVETSIELFCNRWSLVADPAAFDGVHVFTRDRRQQTDPVRRDLLSSNDTGLSFSDRIARNRSTLLDQLQNAGYSEADLWHLSQTCDLASMLHHGGRRADGTPFIEHPIGVASILAHCRVAVPILETAILHAAYSHGRAADDRPADLDEVAGHIGAQCGGTVERRVRDITRLAADPGTWLARHRNLDALRLSAVVTILVTTADMIDELVAHPDAGCSGRERDDTGWRKLLGSVSTAIGLSTLSTAYDMAVAGRHLSWDLFGALRRSAWRIVDGSRQQQANGWVDSWLRQPTIYPGRIPAATLKVTEPRATTGAELR